MIRDFYFNKMAPIFRISWWITMFWVMWSVADPNRSDESGHKESQSQSTLNTANIAAATHRLGFTLRWFPDLETSNAPPASGQQDDLPLFLRRTKFVLHLRERHKWRHYGTTHPVKRDTADAENEQPNAGIEFSAKFGEEYHQENLDISSTQHIVHGATSVFFYMHICCTIN